MNAETLHTTFTQALAEAKSVPAGNVHVPLIENGASVSVATTFALYEGSISVTAVLDKQTHVVTIRVVSQDDDGDVYSDHQSDVPSADLAEEIAETFDSII